MPKYELNVRDYLRILRRRRVTIAVVFMAISISSVAYVSSQPVVYQAATTIKIEERKTIAGLLTELVMYNPGDVMESETKMIKGYPIMKKAALKLGMIDESSPLDVVNNAVGDIQGSIETERVGGTNMIRIIATSDIPKRAMDLANTVAEVYIEENLLDKAKQVRHTRQFIEEQLGQLEERMRVAEEGLRAASGDSKAAIFAGPTQERLIALGFELAELQQRYTDKHPRIIQLREEMARLESQITGLSSKDMGFARLARETEVNKKLYAMLKEKLEEARIAEAEKVGDVSVVDPAVLPGAPVSGNKRAGVLIGIIMGAVLSVALAFILETLDTSISTIEDVEKVVKVPVLGVIPSTKKEPGKKLTFLDMVKDKLFASAADHRKEEGVYLIAHFEPRSPAAEAYRNLHTNMKITPAKKTILVTSSGPREGKSTIVCNLGIIMAQAGLKTLLIGADLRRPILDKAFGVNREPGLNELMTGAVSLKEVLDNIIDIMVGDMDFDDIRKTPGIENIWIIPAGRMSYNPVEILKSKEISSLIEALKTKFDVIIFDAPPVLPVTDSSLLAPKVDTVVLVYEIGRTSREALKRAKMQLESTGAKISGIILNHTQAQSEAIATYPYYKYQYAYYGPEETGKKRKAV